MMGQGEPFGQVAKQVEHYRSAVGEAGFDYHPGRVVLARPMYTAASEEQARRDTHDVFQRQQRCFLFILNFGDAGRFLNLLGRIDGLLCLEKPFPGVCPFLSCLELGVRTPFTSFFQRPPPFSGCSGRY